MPRFDQTGPMGMGPRTGWGRGICAGNVGQPFGMGRRGQKNFAGAGMGPNAWRKFAPQEDVSGAQQESVGLMNRIEQMEKVLDRLVTRLEELENK